MKNRESRRLQRQSGLQKTVEWGAGVDNITGQVTTPGLVTLLTSPQNCRDTRETGHGEKG